MSRLFPAGVKALLVAGVLALGACAQTGTQATTERVSSRAPSLPYAMRWDHVAKSDNWNQSALAALRSYGSALPDTVPRDIDTWCPGYVKASQEEREAFWVGLVSALAKHESTWNQSAVGGGGAWFGLTQISPKTARGYNCEAKSGAELKSGAGNVSCAIRIMSKTVQRDGVVSQGMRGVAADWGPFRNASKRADMINWTRSQPFCQPQKTARVSKAVARRNHDNG